MDRAEAIRLQTQGDYKGQYGSEDDRNSNPPTTLSVVVKYGRPRCNNDEARGPDESCVSKSDQSVTVPIFAKVLKIGDAPKVPKRYRDVRRESPLPAVSATGRTAR